MSTSNGDRTEEVRWVNPDFADELSKVPGAKELWLCLQCGTCTGACPVASFSGAYNPRVILRMAQLGLIAKMLSSDTLWLCAACYRCTDHCPRGVEVASVLRVLRNVAVEDGYIPQILRKIGSNVVKTGFVHKVPESKIRKRKEAGLPPLPKPNPRLVKLAEAVGFTELIKRGE